MGDLPWSTGTTPLGSPAGQDVSERSPPTAATTKPPADEPADDLLSPESPAPEVRAAGLPARPRSRRSRSPPARPPGRTGRRASAGATKQTDFRRERRTMR